MMQTVCLYVLYFFFYSAVGWLGESIYCSLGERRIINRGFLTGPMCPIYGTGTLVLSVCLYPFREHVILVFFAGLVLCDIVEYITSFLMEKLFHARWWDYTNEFLNIKGRICLKHSIYWGLSSVAFVRLVHPRVEQLFSHIDESLLLPVAAVIFSVFVVDLINAVRKALDIRKIQLKLQRLAESIEQMPSHFKANVEELVSGLHLDIEKTGDRLTEKRRDTVEQLQDMLAAIELKLKPSSKNGSKKHKYRQLYANPYLGHSVQVSIDRVRDSYEKAKDKILDGIGKAK